MERQYELENLRRSIAMLRVGAPALDREAAMVLVRELQETMSRFLLKFSGGHSVFRLLPDRTLWLYQRLA